VSVLAGSWPRSMARFSMIRCWARSGSTTRARQASASSASCCASAIRPARVRPAGRAGDRPDPRPQGREEVISQGASVRQWLQRLELGEERVEGQCPARVPAPVDGCLGHPGPGRHLLDGHSVQAPLGQEFCGRTQDCPVRLFAPWAAPVWRASLAPRRPTEYSASPCGLECTVTFKTRRCVSYSRSGQDNEQATRGSSRPDSHSFPAPSPVFPAPGHVPALRAAPGPSAGPGLRAGSAALPGRRAGAHPWWRRSWWCSTSAS